MKAADVIIYRKIEKLESTLMVLGMEIHNRFDKLEKLIVRDKETYVDPALEHEVKTSALHSLHIDAKVGDKK